MSSGGLTRLQERVLEELSLVTPPPTLVGGAALVGFHLGHRRTRDVDLFWWERAGLGSLRETCLHRLREAGLDVDVLQSAPTFCRLRVADGAETIIVDLVAEPGKGPESSEERTLGATRVRVASAQAILANKLCALLGRMELRDLVDVEALLAGGADLHVALRDAAAADLGFSPLTLAWLLRGFDVEGLSAAGGIDGEEARRLAGFRDVLVARLLSETRPDA